MRCMAPFYTGFGRILDFPTLLQERFSRDHSSPGAKPRRIVFSQTARGSTNCSR
jgi:hypothetical protein